MLNIIWPIFIIISIVFSIITGNIDNLNSAILNSGSDAVSITITFLGTMCLWSGIMKIMQETTIINKINNLLYPIMRILFPKIKKGDKAYNEITMNISANILGLGNAATPLGLKAMESLQEKNKTKESLSDEMAMFIIINTASIQIIPTTIIAIRSSLGAQNPTDIIVPIWIATIIADVIGILITKILIKKI